MRRADHHADGKHGLQQPRRAAYYEQDEPLCSRSGAEPCFVRMSRARLDENTAPATRDRTVVRRPLSLSRRHSVCLGCRARVGRDVRYSVDRGSVRVRALRHALIRLGQLRADVFRDGRQLRLVTGVARSSTLERRGLSVCHAGQFCRRSPLSVGAPGGSWCGVTLSIRT